MIQVIKFKVLSSTKIELVFSDGTSGPVDLSAEMKQEPFTALHEPQIWNAVCVEDGSLAWPHGLSIAPETLYAMAHGLKRPESFEDTRANEREMTLRDLRRATHLTQVDVAKNLNVSQPELSRIEAGDDFKLSTIRRYLAGLGYKLECVAVQGDVRVKLRGF